MSPNEEEKFHYTKQNGVGVSDGGGGGGSGDKEEGGEKSSQQHQGKEQL